MTDFDPTKHTIALNVAQGRVDICCDCDPAYDNCSEYSQTLDGKSVLISWSRSFTSPPDHLQGDHANFEPLTVDMSTLKQPTYALEYVPGSPLPDYGSDLWSRPTGSFEYTVSYFEEMFDLNLYQICRDFPSVSRSQIYLPYQIFRVSCFRGSSSSPWTQTVDHEIAWKTWHYPTSDGDPDPTTQTGIDYLRDEATIPGGGDQFYRWQLQREDISDYTISPSDLLTADNPAPPNSWDDVTVSVTFQ
ncbi:MAG: hypothetical protein GY922_17110 [Proteobacteria bacterium]|nr:hypothetical protein [Pseudomonadota bacterium]